MQELKNKLIIVTGGGRGIGRAIAAAFKKHGAFVVAASRSSKDLEETSAELKKINDIPFLVMNCDVTKDSDLKKLYQTSTEKFGPLYGLVCAAGVYGEIGPFAENSFDAWAKAIDINLIGTARSIHSALSFFAKDGGRIILFSGGGQAAMPNFSSYVTSKGGIWRLTETLGAELSSKNIYLNAIAPGAVNTKLLEDLIAAGPDKVGQDFYNKSMQQKENGGQSSEKAADLCLYLMSEKSKGLFGKTLSAVWDPYQEFTNLEKMSRSDIFTAKRVVDYDGNTKAK